MGNYNPPCRSPWIKVSTIFYPSWILGIFFWHILTDWGNQFWMKFVCLMINSPKIEFELICQRKKMNYTSRTIVHTHNYKRYHGELRTTTAHDELTSTCITRCCDPFFRFAYTMLLATMLRRQRGDKLRRNKLICRPTRCTTSANHALFIKVQAW